MLGRGKQTDIKINTKDVGKVALAEFLKYYEHPISEEQAWAICFQCCCKMKQILDQGLDSTLQIIILDINNLYIHFDGSISFTIQHNIEGSPWETISALLSSMEYEQQKIRGLDECSPTKQQPSNVLEDQLIEQLGKVIYEALDWGIESDMERELSKSLEMLISFMLKLDIETTDAAVSFQNVIKICEDHFLKPSEAASHYTVICKVLFAEYIELQDLMITIQSCKEYLRRMDIEDCSVNQKANDSIIPELMNRKEVPGAHTAQALKADVRQDVHDDSQRDTGLHKVMQQTQRKSFPGENTRSSYSTVMDDLKNKRYTLRKVTKRELRERICQQPSLHQQLMMEVKNPPKLKPISMEKTRSCYKENCQRLPMNPSLNSFFSNPIKSTTDFSKPKKPRLNCIQTDSEIKALSHSQYKSAKQSLPSIADLMMTKYFDHVNEIKDFCQKDNSSRAQVCILCHKQIFIWPYMCHLCSRVICKNCCIKMSMPVRPCIWLPLDFFQVVKLGNEKNLDMQNHRTTQLLCKAEHLDSLKIPLVFESHSSSPSLVCHIESMIDWPSLDICAKCEQHLLDILSHQPLCRKRPLLWSDQEELHFQSE